MSRIVYVNGRYVPYRQAQIHVEDRGYQFADGVYEVCGLRRGGPVDEAAHLARLDRSLTALKISWPVHPSALRLICREIAECSRVRFGFLYIQITRGAARRDHAFPPPASSSLVVLARRLDEAAMKSRAAQGIAAITRPDIRWGRCDIKSLALLPNVLARQSALDAGADDAILVDGQGFITEAAAANVWIVTQAGALATRPAGADILGGITRSALLEEGRALGLTLEERTFTPQEAAQAREMFLTSSVGGVVPVVRLDGAPIGEGPGPVAAQLRHALEKKISARMASSL